MADALAFLYWTAKVDANDIEFVLARPRQSRDLSMGNADSSVAAGPGIGVRPFFCKTFGKHEMWILDFDCCREMAMDEEGVKRAAQCFWRNDPFYPRPCSASGLDDGDRRRWELFSARLLETSRGILQSESEEIRGLPESLMAQIVKDEARWSKGAVVG
jgi:hypothetical protein